jgi:hypothetical protein
MWLLAVLVFVASESEKVRPESPVPPQVAAPRLKLTAAGSECTGAQLVVRGPVSKLSATASEGIALSRVATITLRYPSGPDGATGEWPDALIPARDTLYKEERRAFPVDVPAGRSQSIFVEWCARKAAGPSRSAGWVRLSWNGGGMAVPVELRVRGFDLPATPALATAFGFSGWSAARAHGLPPESARELTRLYNLLALRRGVTLMGGTQEPPSFDKSTGRIDWREYDAEVGPFLDGVEGARWTTVELREPPKLDREQRRAFRKAYVEHFRQRGWLSRLYRYVIDEPPTKDFPKVEAMAREYKEDVPEVRRLVTTTITDELPDVDLFVPTINCIGPRNDSCPRSAPRALYKTLWWYQACMTHGCSDDGKPVLHPAFHGWPSYMIDAPATAARVMGTLAFVYDVPGELYFDTVYAEKDPWQDQWAFGGNGDGTLFYPGKPSIVGGKHDIPIESLRFVQISRGIADHAYLTLCARLGDRSLAMAEAKAVAPEFRTFSRDPKAYAQMREHLAVRIEALLAAKKSLQP